MRLLVLSVVSLLSTSAGAIALDHLQTTNDIGINKVPHRGTSKVLVIPMRVQQELTAFEQEELDTVFNPAGGPGTFRGFYQAQSLGAYDPVPTLAEVLYYDECPISLANDDCHLNITDFQTFSAGEIRALITDMLERVRDEQGVDLSQFDINSADCPDDQECPDGYLDGLIVSTNIFGGIAFPLAALSSGNPVTVLAEPQPIPDAGPGLDAGPALDGGPTLDAGPPDASVPDGPTISVGILALVKPYMHEFAHTLGFIDHYRLNVELNPGPTVNDLMALEGRGFSAFSRTQIGWSTFTEVTEPGTYMLEPVLQGGTILKFGGEEKFVTVANRQGVLHEDYDSSPPGIYLHSVDMRQLPTTPLGFVDLLGGQLYYPNQNPPYLNASMPLDCRLTDDIDFLPCRAIEGSARNIEHASDGLLGFYITVDMVSADGTAQVTVHEGTREESLPDAGAPDAAAGEPEPQPEPEPIGNNSDDDCGCASSPVESLPLAGLLLLVASLRRRRHNRRS